MITKVLIERENNNRQEVLIEPSASDFVHLVASGNVKNFSPQEKRVIGFFSHAPSLFFLGLASLILTMTGLLFQRFGLLSVQIIVPLVLVGYTGLLAYVLYMRTRWTRIVVPKQYTSKIKAVLNNDKDARQVTLAVTNAALSERGRINQKTVTVATRLSNRAVFELRKEFKDVRRTQPKDLYVSNQATDREWSEGRF